MRHCIPEITLTDYLCQKEEKRWLYVSRRERGSELASIKGSVDASIQRLENYIQKCGGRRIATTRNNTNDTRTSGTTITRKQILEGKQPSGRFKRLTSDISHEKTRILLRKGNLKRESKSLQIAAQNNTIKTNPIKAWIDKTQQKSSCTLCGDRDETINQSISECSKLA